MTLILRLLLALGAASLMASCSNTTPPNSAAQAVLAIQFAPPHVKSKPRSAATSTPSLPAELTRVVFEIRDDKGELISEGDWLKSNGKLEFKLPPGVQYSLKGTAYAGEEVLFNGTARVAPLNAGERRPIAVALAPQVNLLVAPERNETNSATPQAIVRVNVGANEKVRLTSTVSGLNDKRLSWQVNQVEGGNSTVGTIDANGEYTPPNVLPDNTIVIIQAVPLAAPSFESSVTIQLLNKIPSKDTQPPVSHATPVGAEFVETVTVVLSCDDCKSIYYTTDGTTPNFTSLIYEEPIIIRHDFDLNFFSLDSAGNSETTVRSETYRVINSPSAPTFSNVSAGNGQVSLSWSSIPYATKYKLYRSLTDTITSTAVPLLDSLTDPSFFDETVSNGTAYFYAVVAVNRAGVSPLSEIRKATPLPNKPIAPTVLQASASDSHVFLSWQSSGVGVTYSLYRRTREEQFVDSSPFVFGLEGTEFNDATVINGVTYFYIVKASNLAGLSAASNEERASPLPLIALAPAGLTAVASDRQVILTWEPSAKADSYTVYRSLSAEVMATGTAFATKIDGNSLLDTNVENGMTYYYAVVAVNLAGVSVPSVIVSAKPTLSPCVWDASSWNSCLWQ